MKLTSFLHKLYLTMVKLYWNTIHALASTLKTCTMPYNQKISRTMQNPNMTWGVLTIEFMLNNKLHYSGLWQRNTEKQYEFWPKEGQLMARYIKQQIVIKKQMIPKQKCLSNFIPEEFRSVQHTFEHCFLWKCHIEVYSQNATVFFTANFLHMPYPLKFQNML